MTAHVVECSQKLQPDVMEFVNRTVAEGCWGILNNGQMINCLFMSLQMIANNVIIGGDRVNRLRNEWLTTNTLHGWSMKGFLQTKTKLATTNPCTTDEMSMKHYHAITTMKNYFCHLHR